MHHMPFLKLAVGPSTTIQNWKINLIYQNMKAQSNIMLKQRNKTKHQMGFLIQIANPKEEQMFKNWLGPTNM